MNVVSIRRRTEAIHVKRVLVARAAENALAANQSARDAIERATQHIWSGNRAGALHELGRMGFEVGERTEALMELTRIAEQAVACPDGLAQVGHGSAA